MVRLDKIKNLELLDNVSLANIEGRYRYKDLLKILRLGNLGLISDISLIHENNIIFSYCGALDTIFTSHSYTDLKIHKRKIYVK